MGKHRILRLFAISLTTLLVTLAIWVFTTTRFVFLHHYEGLFLLRGSDGKRFQVQDDLFLGDGSRLIAGIAFDRLKNWLRETGHQRDDTYLTWEWDKDDGEGYVIQHFPGGKQLLTHFSRYVDSQGEHTRGLFVGGALPDAAVEVNGMEPSNTGMAWYDGANWYHLWCNTNEGISSPVSRTGSPPNQWEFLGSNVLIGSNNKLVIKSVHGIALDQTRLHMERYAYFTAGNPYFSLGITLTNTGAHPVHFNYLYADEPWIGTFGTSAGDIGWVEGQLIAEEQYIDPSRHFYAGMTDRGNPLIGEQGNFSGIANFIAWAEGSRPDAIFFANQYFGIRHPAETRVPLHGDARSIGLEWKRALRPGETVKFFLRLGIAAVNPATGLPTVPPLRPFPDFRALGTR